MGQYMISSGMPGLIQGVIAAEEEDGLGELVHRERGSVPPPGWIWVRHPPLPALVWPGFDPVT